ncbi:hypothetical protein SVA_1553 [Sulfurifustis variabilis]|uniref:Fibronectin type-III domain-containing protein n=1 Tax=Sulfurifustis variabilis TaxID=1675686 RepID=A0A1B4V415_9GAMM|nr:fibronectin type III domain-containing protein [Sulfurifustis variabilis]BAU48115.1 hypothetical protein SVA_1553 [Sulfurifustis variabilis]
MRHIFWVPLLVASMTACSGGSGQDSSAPTGDQPGSPSQVYTPPAPGSATDVVLQLTWQPNSDPVAGYRVYFGTTPEGATAQLSDLAVANRALNSQAPSVSYNAGNDLGLDPGSQACFRLRAYNSEGVMSDWSQPACATI